MVPGALNLLIGEAYVDKENAAVTWIINGEIVDLAPDTMYKEIKNNNDVYMLQ